MPPLGFATKSPSCYNWGFFIAISVLFWFLNAANGSGRENSWGNKMTDWKAEFMYAMDEYNAGGDGIDWLEVCVYIARSNLTALTSTLGRPEEWMRLWRESPEDAVIVAAVELQRDHRPIGEMLSQQAAADLLSCSIEHVQKLQKDGHLKPIHIGKRIVRFDRNQVEHWLRSGGLNQ
jgi:excisionase family DNA binding protein